MRKNLIFNIPMILLAFALFMFRKTGLTAHIVLSLVGLAILLVYTILTKKEWSLPIVEIVMRASYAIALITGVVLMNVTGMVAFSVIHKIFAAVFLILLVFLMVMKATKKKA